MIERKVKVYHDKHHHRILVTVHDSSVSITYSFSPEEAEGIGDMGKLAHVYRDNTENK